MTANPMQQKWNYSIQGNGPPLVFIHGMLGFARNFLSIARALQANHTTLIYDQRGHGRSLKESPYTLLRLTEDLRCLIALLPAKEKVSLVGHSLGGYVSLLFAQKHPEKVERLIIVDSSPRPSSVGFQRISYLLKQLPASFANSKEGRDFFKRKVEEGLFSKSMGDFLYSNLTKTPHFDKMEFAFDRKGLLKLLQDVRAYDFWRIVEDLKRFTLFLRGEVSSHFTREDFEQLKTKNPAFVKAEEIPKAGHWLHQEKKELFIERVKNFL